jgi:hypothetical protein
MILILLASLLYFELPKSPEDYSINMPLENLPENTTLNEQPIITYGITPVFQEKMRFRNKRISFFLEPECTANRKERMREAFIIMENKTNNLLDFYEIRDKESAEIKVGCSEDYIEEGDEQFRAGEGGPSKIINTTLYNVILEGKIILYKESQCDYPVVELHELLHVLSFDHSSNPINIMYNLSSCEQKITQDIIDRLLSLYIVDSKPELYFHDIMAVKKGSYLDFNVTIKNRGLADSPATQLVLSDSNKKEIRSFEIGGIEIGAGKILSVKNLKIPYFSGDIINFEVDKEDKIPEIQEDNNIVELVLQD